MKNKILTIIFLLLIILLFPAILKCNNIKPHSDRLISSNVSDITDSVEPDAAGDYPPDSYNCSYTISDNESKRFVYIKGFWTSVTVYADDDIIYSGNDKNPNNDMSVCWFSIPAGTGEHTLYIHAVSKKTHYNDEVISEIILADKGDFNEYIFMNNIYAFIFFIFALITGLLCLIGALSMRRRVSQNSYLTFTYLGIFILLAGTWLLLDSKLLLLVTNRTALISLASYTVFMLMPAVLIMYISEMSSGSQRPYYILCGIILANTALYLISYILAPVMIPYVLSACHIMIMSAIIYVLYRCIRSAGSYNTPELKSILAGFIFMCLFSLMALISFYISSSSHYSYVYAIGLAIFITCMITASLQRMYSYITDNANVSAYKQLAYIDSLTGLMNKASFTTEHIKPITSPTAYIMFDLNGLKHTNDTYGHKEGDELIAAAAECIRAVFGRIGKCYRFGGDELIVILYGFKARDIDALLNYKLPAVINSYNSNRDIPLDVSYGYAICNDNSVTRHELFKQADERMYAMKKSVEGCSR